jgi:hypothetical protein
LPIRAPNAGSEDYVIRRNFLFCLCLAVGASSTHAQQEPPAAPPAQQPAPQAPAPKPPVPEAKVPPPKPGAPGPKAPPIYDTSDGYFSLAGFYWFTTGTPTMHSGKAATPGTAPSDLDYPGKGNFTPGVIISIPAGENNTIRGSYFRTTGSGTTVATKDLNFFGADYPAGTLLNPSYTLQNAKLSLDYMSWPFPLKDRRFRFKTLWEIQYTTIQTTIHAPVLEAADSTITPAVKTNWFFYPSFGIGIEEMLSKHARFETKASGFAFPHRSTIWDAEATLAYRMGPVELFAGGSAFHFKTSPKQEEYVHATLSGAFVGLRWYPKF